MCAAQRPLCAATDSATAGSDARELLDADAVVDRRHRRRRRTPRGTGCPSARGRRASAAGPSGNSCASSHSMTCGPDLRLGELADRAAQQLLLVGRAEIHGDCTNVSRGLGVGARARGFGAARPSSIAEACRIASRWSSLPCSSCCRRRRRPTSPRFSAPTRRRPIASPRGSAIGTRPRDRRLRVRVRAHQRRPRRSSRRAADVHVQRPAADAGPDRRHAVLRDGRRRGLPRDARTTTRKPTSASTSAAA